MRRAMQQRLGSRERFTAKFERWGMKSGWAGPQKTMLVKDVRDAQGELMADHLWFTCGKWTDKLGEMHSGDALAFDARITEYEKGYKGYREDVDKPVQTDYRLSHPTRIERV